MPEILQIIGTGGSAVAVIYVVILFLKDRAERDTKFADTVKEIIHNCDQSAAQSRADIKEIISQYIEVCEKTVDVCKETVIATRDNANAVKELKDSIDSIKNEIVKKQG